MSVPSGTGPSQFRPWSPDGVPFSWMPKPAARRIEQEIEQPATALLVYLALTRIASDEGSATFTKPIQYIAKLACLNRRTVERRLGDLERIEVVRVDRGVMGTAHQYTLATLSRTAATQSRKGATQNDAVPVALSREQEKGRSAAPNEEGRAIAKRIALEKVIEIIKGHLRDLEDRGALDGWTEELLKAKRAKKAKLVALEEKYATLF